MSHYFYDDGFDFFSNDGNFGFYIEQGNGRTSTSFGVNEEYVIEVHYLGEAITSLQLDVTQIDHTDTLDDVTYVSKGFIGRNGTTDTDGYRFGNDGPLVWVRNDDLTSSDSDYIVQNGTTPAETYWQVQQGGLDPIYGLIEINIPNAGATEANGNRDHDYLYLEAGLYFDVIQNQSSLVTSLQGLIDGTVTLDTFASNLETATDGVANMDFSIQKDASNEVVEMMAGATSLNEVPHMIHFDHINYYGYDDFAAPVTLNTGSQMNSLSETSLIGEIRIDENTSGEWSFDAELSVWLNTENRTGQYTPVNVPMYPGAVTTMDLNQEFINYSGSMENQSDVKLTINRAADGNITITETLEPIDTLAQTTSITFATSQTFGSTTIDTGTYALYYYDGSPSDFYFQSLNSEGTNNAGTEIYSFGSNNRSLTEGSSNGFEEFVIAINNGSITPGAPLTMLFDDISTSPFVIDITDTSNSVYFDDSGSTSSDKLGVGPYLVNVKAGNVVTLTEIVTDTDYDGIDELATEYTLWNGQGDYGYYDFRGKINGKHISINESKTYESADQVIMKIDELDQTWNSVEITSGNYMTDSTTVPNGKYKVSHDVDTDIISLQAIKDVGGGEYDIDDKTAPFVLNSSSSNQFILSINDTTLTANQFTYKQYFYDLINTDTVNGAEVITYGSETISSQGGTEYVTTASFDNTKNNFINTDVVTDVTSVDAGAGNDIIAGGVGGLSVDGGLGFDMYLTTPASIKIETDANGNITSEDGVIIDLDSGFTYYLDAGTNEKVDGIEYFMGTLGDDQFYGTALYSVNSGYVDASHQNYIQVFNPTKGKDEIFGAETIPDLTGKVIDVLTAVDYDGMTGGQGVIFILDGSDAATHAAEAGGEISYQKISEFAGDYWDATSWAGDGWLPSNEDIVNANGNFSTISKHEPDQQGATLILDSFGDTDLAFNVDHYIGSGDADIFFGAAGDDSFDASNGTGNYMSGGDGLDRLIVSDQNQLEPDGANYKDAEEDLDLDTITVNRNIDYSYSNHIDIDYNSGSGELVSDSSNLQTGAPLYRIDFADVNNVSEFLKQNAASDIYSVSKEYALFLRTSMDLSSGLTGGLTFDSANLTIEVDGSISLLDSLSGQLVLAEENQIVEGYIVQGLENGGDAYSTVIENVEQVSLLSNDINYFGTGGDISGSQEDIYQLITGGQGDLGQMLYVTTGETLASTTGVTSGYTAGSNFLTGEIFYSGHHTDFDRNTNPSTWANSVASAFVVGNSPTAKIWNNEIAQFFVWYDADTTDNIDGYEIAVRYQNGNINAWGIDNRQFDTFQNVTVDQSLVDAIKLQFGNTLNVALGDYRILYEAAYTDIETLISSDVDVSKWNFDFTPTSSRSTFYIQVGGAATGENGSSGILDTQVTNVKVEREEVGGVMTWVVNPQAEILVNLPVLAGADENDNLMISGDAAETIEAGRGSDVMMGRGGSDNYKISAGDTLGVGGTEVVGSYGVVGDVINEIGGSSDDKSDSITLSSVTNIDQLTFSRVQIANEYWSNTLKIDVANETGPNDILYVFDHYNQNLESRAVEQLFLDDGWDADEIWNLIVGDVNGTTGVDEYTGTAGQDILIAGTEKSTLYGGDGQDIMIGDEYSKETTFELGNRDGSSAWDKVADIIEGFGKGDELDLSALNITSSDITVSNNELQLVADGTVIAEFKNFNDGLTLQNLLDETGYIDYGAA